VLETQMAVEAGAQEIDMVVNRGIWNEKNEVKVIEEILRIKHACREARLKVILETCELKSLESIYKLSYLSLMSGADFIKTSTGKGSHGAKLEHFIVMAMALRDFLIYNANTKLRGIKPAGGIS